jgi:hypothetical protein
MWTWIVIGVIGKCSFALCLKFSFNFKILFYVVGVCKSEEPLTGVKFLTTLLPETTLLPKNEPTFITDFPTTQTPLKMENKTLEETQKRLQMIANITIAQFLNNHTRRNLSLAEILELRDLGNLVMNPNFMIPEILGKNKSNKSDTTRLTLPSTFMMNFGHAILKSNFMPPAFLQPTNPIKQNATEEQEDGDVDESSILKNATMDEALSTMTFHRY